MSGTLYPIPMQLVVFYNPTHLGCNKMSKITTPQQNFSSDMKAASTEQITFTANI
jgi:hypothetical protein